MASFRSPISHSLASEKLRGLDLQSIEIARRPDHYDRLNQFIASYQAPAILETLVDGEVRQFDTRRMSAIGEQGSLLHIRLEKYRPDIALQSQLAHIAIIGHLDDPGPPQVLMATSETHQSFQSRLRTEFQVTAELEPLRAVEDYECDIDWYVEQAIAREKNYQTAPLIVLSDEGWEYRRGDGHRERLCDLVGMQTRVYEAVIRGLGDASLTSRRAGTEIGSGQFSEKVVV